MGLTVKLSNSKLILIILSILCVVMIGATTVKDELLSPVRTAFGYFLEPVQSGVNRVGRSLYNNIKDREKLKTALEDNRKLEARINELLMENTRLEEDRFELDRLRALYELDRKYGQYRMVGARVIAKDAGGWFQVFRIDKGSADGIRADMNVMAGGGLVGIVTDVGANYATVRSIIDDVSRVSGMGMQSGDTCIVSGDLKLYEQGELKLSDITDTADIKEGDKIVTSTVSSKYLPGILIGYVKEIRTDPARLTRSGTLIPAADFGTLQEVLVVLDLKSEMHEKPTGAEAGISAGTVSGADEASAGGAGEEAGTGEDPGPADASESGAEDAAGSAGGAGDSAASAGSGASETAAAAEETAAAREDRREDTSSEARNEGRGADTAPEAREEGRGADTSPEARDEGRETEERVREPERPEPLEVRADEPAGNGEAAPSEEPFAEIVREDTQAAPETEPAEMVESPPAAP